MRKDISKDAIKVVESAIEEGGDKKVTFEVPVSDFYKVDLGEEAKIPEIHYNNEIITKSEIADILINAYENLSITK